MPHLTLEYTRNLGGFEPRGLLQALNETLASSGHFVPRDIMSRTHCVDTFVVGVAGEAAGFVHLRLAIFGGRSAEVKQAISARLLQTLQHHLPPQPGIEVQYCVEIQDIDRDTYAKTVHPA